MFYGIIGAIVGEIKFCYLKLSLLTLSQIIAMQWVLHRDVSDGNSMLLVWNISAESTIPPHPKNIPEGWTSIRDGMTSDWGSAVDYTDLVGKEHLPYTVSCFLTFDIILI
jgi:hypothetical protein